MKLFKTNNKKIWSVKIDQRYKLLTSIKYFTSLAIFVPNVYLKKKIFFNMS